MTSQELTADTLWICRREATLFSAAGLGRRKPSVGVGDGRWTPPGAPKRTSLLFEFTISVGNRINPYESDRWKEEVEYFFGIPLAIKNVSGLIFEHRKCQYMWLTIESYGLVSCKLGLLVAQIIMNTYSRRLINSSLIKNVMLRYVYSMNTFLDMYI